MKILYIWHGERHLPESRAQAIAATMNLYPDAEYFCITTLGHFFSDAFKVISWDYVMDCMLRSFDFQERPYRWNEYMCFSDWARFWYLGNHGDTLYLDTDAQMLKRYEFGGDKVIYPEREICLLYSPASEARIKLLDLLEQRAGQHVNLLIDFAGKLNPAWSTTISREFFHHHT